MRESAPGAWNSFLAALEATLSCLAPLCLRSVPEAGPPAVLPAAACSCWAAYCAPSNPECLAATAGLSRAVGQIGHTCRSSAASLVLGLLYAPRLQACEQARRQAPSAALHVSVLLQQQKTAWLDNVPHDDVDEADHHGILAEGQLRCHGCTCAGEGAPGVVTKLDCILC